VKQLQGKALSFNNLADMDATLRAVFHFDEPACVVTKHMNPCGAAVHADGPEAAFLLALSADPVSAYGGIVCFNRTVDGDTARALRKSRTFFEVLAAPGFTSEARELLAPREKLRVMELPQDWAACTPGGTDARRVQGGWLLQDWDLGAPITWKVSTARAPSPEEEGALRFAWGVVQHVKSNAIVLARAEEGGYVLNGVGAGQMSRVDSVRIALSKATRPVEGSVMASDAFFPFSDGVEVAVKAGIEAIIQPGGSIRDDAVVAAVNESEATMVFTGARHFRH
jgi:phosphoribosylaminoimidazolecarboxamide formyltransferase/IMP cyclohydrolase